LKLLNWPDADKNAKSIVDFETKMADASWTKAQHRDFNAIYDPMSVQDLKNFPSRRAGLVSQLVAAVVTIADAPWWSPLMTEAQPGLRTRARLGSHCRV
jgi:predicted metalloendopeptidase